VLRFRAHLLFPGCFPRLVGSQPWTETLAGKRLDQFNAPHLGGASVPASRRRILFSAREDGSPHQFSKISASRIYPQIPVRE